VRAEERSFFTVLRGESLWGRGVSEGRGLTPGTPSPRRLPAAFEICWREESPVDIVRGVDVARGSPSGQLPWSEEESTIVTDGSISAEEVELLRE
jgi:hypothetical protein